MTPRAGKDFASNDYLGLAGSTLLHDALREGMALGLPAGSGGSRLLRGNHPAHEALEAACKAGAVAVLVEPLVLGAGGMPMYPPHVLTGMAAICPALPITRWSPMSADAARSQHSIFQATPADNCQAGRCISAAMHAPMAC